MLWGKGSRAAGVCRGALQARSLHAGVRQGFRALLPPLGLVGGGWPLFAVRRKALYSAYSLTILPRAKAVR